MNDLARPDLPAHHPQNIPLTQWSDGWLKMSCTEYCGDQFIIMHDHEKRDRNMPVTRAEMISLLIHHGDIPAAGIEA